MSDFDDAVLDLNAATLVSLGDPITYIPNRGVGDPIETTCFLKSPSIDQSAAPGYFGDIDIDPLVVPFPSKGDQVAWVDGTFYVVTKVVKLPPGLITVALHRKFDPV